MSAESRTGPTRAFAERRRVLKVLGLGAVGAIGCTSYPELAAIAQGPPGETGPGSIADRSAGQSTEPRILEVLHKAITLSSGDVLENRRFVIAPDFAWSTTRAVIYGNGEGIVIRNVEIVGASRWQSRWNQLNEADGGPPGIPAGCAGIRLQHAPGVQIIDVGVRGFPIHGITGFGIDEAVIQRIRVSNCFHGVVTEWYQPNHHVLVDDVHVTDLWGPGPGKWPGIGGHPSRARAGEFIGGDGLVLASLRDSQVRNCTVLGEQFVSMKLVNPQRVQATRINGPGIMVQGTSDREWKIDRTPARDVSIISCTIDKSLGEGEMVEEGNALQVSWNVENILIRDTLVRAAGKNGHAIEFAGNVRGRVEGCSIEGFNGKRFLNPAYAILVADNSSVNADFEQVNTFVNQKRLINRVP